MNEVLASRATQLIRAVPQGDAVHPLDHVNRSQSTNDVYPTAMNIAVLGGRRGCGGHLSPDRGVRGTGRSHPRRAGAARPHLRAGCAAGADRRRHAPDARARTVACRDDLIQSINRLRAVPLGATAVGHGLRRAGRGIERRAARVVAETGLELTAVDDPFDALAHADPHLA